MSLDFRFGRADSAEEFDKIADLAASYPQGYEPQSHQDWAYGKFLGYMQSGDAIPCPVLHDDTLASVVVGYTEPTDNPGELPGIEAKLVRTLPGYFGRGLAALGVKTLLVHGAVEMGLSPGSRIRMHLDTRSPQIIGAFAAMGFVQTGQANLYAPDPKQPDTADLLMERIFTVPDPSVS